MFGKYSQRYSENIFLLGGIKGKGERMKGICKLSQSHKFGFVSVTDWQIQPETVVNFEFSIFMNKNHNPGLPLKMSG